MQKNNDCHIERSCHFLAVFILCLWILGALSSCGDSSTSTYSPAIHLPETKYVFVVPPKPTYPKPPKPPAWKNKYESYSKVESCLLRNVFYESPRYYEGKEEALGLSKEELQDKIVKEWVKVINVTQNRVKSNRFGNDICDVVYQYKQFSWTLEHHKTTTSLYTKYANNPIEMENIRAMRTLVKYALYYDLPDLTNGSLFYHTHYVDPYWAEGKEITVASRWHKYYNK
jgi:hypothetical protein